MIRYSLLLSLTLLFCSTGLELRSQDADIYSYNNSLLYANHLFGIRKYKAAALEYERVLFLNPKDPVIHERLIDAYFAGGDFSSGISRIRSLYPKNKGMSGKLAFTYSKILLLAGEEIRFTRFISHSDDLKNDDRLIVEVGNHLLHKNWTEAQNLFQKQLSVDKRMKGYQSVINQSLEIKRKKPAMALALSTLLPGLGRVYTRQWKDGVISFALIGGLSYASYRNFRNQGRDSALAWIYGGLALGFYAGNLYGSYQSAHRFNDRSSTKIQDETLYLLHRHF